MLAAEEVVERELGIVNNINADLRDVPIKPFQAIAQPRLELVLLMRGGLC